LEVTQELDELVDVVLEVSQKFESALVITLIEMNLSKEVRLACKIDELIEGSAFSLLVLPFFQSDQQCCEGLRSSSQISSVAKGVCSSSLISSVAKGVALPV
uniref:Ovule protein n=1 Tax=Rodentolepis nana TaxID=102285 RepID=A0A0R3TYK5_RODNA